MNKIFKLLIEVFIAYGIILFGAFVLIKLGFNINIGKLAVLCGFSILGVLIARKHLTKRKER